MKIRLSDHFTCRRLLRFTLPSIVMMIFTSIYGVVDGLFVSNFVGKTPFAAINLIMPFLMAFGALGFMIGTGGSALVAKTMGEGDRERANALFSRGRILSGPPGRTATTRPPASSAPRCARASMPMARPLTMVTPCAAMAALSSRVARAPCRVVRNIASGCHICDCKNRRCPPCCGSCH